MPFVSALPHLGASSSPSPCSPPAAPSPTEPHLSLSTQPRHPPQKALWLHWDPAPLFQQPQQDARLPGDKGHMEGLCPTHPLLHNTSSTQQVPEKASLCCLARSLAPACCQLFLTACKLLMPCRSHDMAVLAAPQAGHGDAASDEGQEPARGSPACSDLTPICPGCISSACS